MAERRRPDPVPPDLELPNVGGPHDERRMRLWRLAHGYSLIHYMPVPDLSELLFLRNGEPFLWVTGWLSAFGDVEESVAVYAAGIHAAILKHGLADMPATTADQFMSEFKINAVEMFAPGMGAHVQDYGAADILNAILRSRGG
jgi:hypothetical protein